MSFQITEMSSKLSDYETRLDNMSFNNISKFDTAIKENEELSQNKID